MNENAKRFEVLKETQRKLKVKVNACKLELNDDKEIFSHKQVKKCDLGSMTK